MLGIKKLKKKSKTSFLQSRNLFLLIICRISRTENEWRDYRSHVGSSCHVSAVFDDRLLSAGRQETGQKKNRETRKVRGPALFLPLRRHEAKTDVCLLPLLIDGNVLDPVSVCLPQM